jgi:hypothetical protein
MGKYRDAIGSFFLEEKHEWSSGSMVVVICLSVCMVKQAVIV